MKAMILLWVLLLLSNPTNGQDVMGKEKEVKSETVENVEEKKVQPNLIFVLVSFSGKYNSLVFLSGR